MCGLASSQWSWREATEFLCTKPVDVCPSERFLGTKNLPPLFLAMISRAHKVYCRGLLSFRRLACYFRQYSSFFFFHPSESLQRVSEEFLDPGNTQKQQQQHRSEFPSPDFLSKYDEDETGGFSERGERGHWSRPFRKISYSSHPPVSPPLFGS